MKKTKAGQESIWKDGAPFMTLIPGMWDYDLRIKAMDKAKVDVAIISLTCPNCFFGDRATSLKAAQIVNDSMAEQSRARPDRIRWFASIPWQYADDAKAELARCVKAGAVGVMQLANVVGEELTDEKFAPVWAEIDRLGLAGADPSRHAAGHGGHEPRRIRPGAADRLHDRHHARVRAHDLVGLHRPVSEPEADRRAWRRDACRISPAGSTAATR